MQICSKCSSLYPDDVTYCDRDNADLRPLADPMVGKDLADRYRLLYRLGAGGMSSVYLARDLHDERLAAVKLLRQDLAKHTAQRDRFIREARAINRVRHQNVVAIDDLGETNDGYVYIVMEYVPGEPLYKLMAEGGLIEINKAVDIAVQVVAALGAMHQAGVVHRDLKPDNILLVSGEDNRLVVKVVDFGIAKILDAPPLTGSQHIFGTPGYIAPEYIQSTHIDGRADLYSLGIILYEMITGALPFDYEYPADLLAKHLSERPVPPSLRCPEIDPRIERVIMRCLEKDVARRYPDAAALFSELNALQQSLRGDVFERSSQIRVKRPRLTSENAEEQFARMPTTAWMRPSSLKAAVGMTTQRIDETYQHVLSSIRRL